MAEINQNLLPSTENQDPVNKFPSGRSLDEVKSRSIVQLIRTHSLEWTVPFSDGTKATLLLNLDLWDGPSDENGSEDLPLSLRRFPVGQIPLDLFSDLSVVFGIGQHITLSLQKNQGLTDNVVWALGKTLVQRHDAKLTPWIAMSTLSNCLQSSLQFALSNISCNIPAFGIWGTYAPFSLSDIEFNPFHDHAPLLPSWIQEWNTPTRQRFFFRSLDPVTNQTFVSPILKSTMLCETQFWMSVMSSHAINTSRLTAWGNILLQHSSTPSVVLCGAKHMYTWKKLNESSYEWRKHLSPRIDETPHKENLMLYQEQCRRYATSLFERFSGASLSNPLWGAIEDPIEAVNMIIRWDPTSESDGNPECLLSLPLQSRSLESMTKQDWEELEHAVESAVLNPLRPSAFNVYPVYDAKAPLVNLSASLRLLLAALIRTAVLPANTMIHQLTDDRELEAYHNEHVDDVTMNLVNRAGVGQITRQLVGAIDWAAMIEEMIEGWEAELIIQKIMDGKLTMNFPDPPDQVFLDPDGTAPTELFAALPKSASPGRLLSILFVHMARLRSPSSMALVWGYFVHDLQKRFYSRTSLPNMMYVPGLDPSPKMLETKRCFSTKGLRVKATNAAYVHCSEPQPDDMNCLIGQKLQVFNIGIESIVATEIFEANKMSQSFDQDDGNGKGSRKKVVDTIPSQKEGCHLNEMSVDDKTNTTGLDFHDAIECGSLSEFSHTGDPNITLMRQGARCPVMGVSLLANGAQLYAPYLLRPVPLTDDMILERQQILSRTAKGASIRERLEVAHRYLSPKLLSDMKAFKAANPGSVFEDFINWYGGPADALEVLDKAIEGDGWYFLRSEDNTESPAKRRARAMEVLSATCDFWIKTWEMATPEPAVEQEPLFDLSNTVELVLDTLETIHPASLLNQIMAVNLSMAYFAIVSTIGNGWQLPSVRTSLHRLRSHIEAALQILSQDVKLGTSNVDPTSPEQLPRHASLQSIRACEDVCNVLSEVETLLSRATSLLHKFPEQYEFVEQMLESRTLVPLDDSKARAAILKLVQEQQGRQEALPIPVRRSYILRNTDKEAPCQMCVRYGEVGVFKDREGGILISMTISSNKKTHE
jgi:Rab3 GTPase-activating protein catalytic subunit